MSVNLPSPSAASAAPSSGAAAIASPTTDESIASAFQATSNKEFSQVFSSINRSSTSASSSKAKAGDSAKLQKTRDSYASDTQSSSSRSPSRKPSQKKDQADSSASSDDQKDASESSSSSADTKGAVLAEEAASVAAAALSTPVSPAPAAEPESGDLATSEDAVCAPVSEGFLGTFGSFKVVSDSVPTEQAGQGDAEGFNSGSEAETPIQTATQNAGATGAKVARTAESAQPTQVVDADFQAAMESVSESSLVSSVSIRAVSSDVKVVNEALQQAGLIADQDTAQAPSSVVDPRQVILGTTEAASSDTTVQLPETAADAKASADVNAETVEDKNLGGSSGKVFENTLASSGEKNALQSKDNSGKSGQEHGSFDKKGSQVAGLHAEEEDSETNGIFGAKSEETMFRDDSSTDTATRSLISHEGASGIVATSDKTGGLSQAQQTEQANQAYASRTLNAVKDITEKLQSTAPRTVEFDLSLKDGHQISVSLAFRNGAVHTTISTDSRELREALSKEWASSMPATIQGSDTLRVSQPQFADSSSSRNGSFDPNGQASRQQQWQHQASESRLGTFSRSSSSNTQTPVSETTQNQQTMVVDSARRLNAIA